MPDPVSLGAVAGDGAAKPVDVTVLVTDDAKPRQPDEPVILQPAKAIPRRAVSHTLTVQLSDEDKLSEGVVVILRHTASDDGGATWYTLCQATWTSYGPKGIIGRQADGTLAANPDPVLIAPMTRRVGQHVRAEVIVKGEASKTLAATLKQAIQAPITLPKGR